MKHWVKKLGYGESWLLVVRKIKQPVKDNLM